MRFQKNSIVARLIEEHEAAKDALLPINGTDNAFTAPMRYPFYRPIARQDTLSYPLTLEGELTTEIYDEAFGLNPKDLPVDVWRAYYHLLDDVSVYKCFEKLAVLDYSIGDYAIYIQFPLASLFVDRPSDEAAQTAQLRRIAKTAQAINPVARVYYEPRPYLKHTRNYATIALPIDVTAAQVADILYGMLEDIEDVNITPEQVVAKLEGARGTTEYNELWGGMLREYEVALGEDTEVGYLHTGKEIIAYATFTDGKEEIHTRFRHYESKDYSNAYDFLPADIDIRGDARELDGISPKTLKDAVWLVMSTAAGWGWEFVEAEADIPDDAEHKTYNMAEAIHG